MLVGKSLFDMDLIRPMHLRAPKTHHPFALCSCAPKHTIHPSIQAIGFDMDYTLAQYKPETFEGLAHQQTVRCVEWTISIVFETGQQNLLLYMYSHKYRQGSPPLSLLALNDAETSA